MGAEPVVVPQLTELSYSPVDESEQDLGLQQDFSFKKTFNKAKNGVKKAVPQVKKVAKKAAKVTADATRIASQVAHEAAPIAKQFMPEYAD